MLCPEAFMGASNASKAMKKVATIQTLVFIKSSASCSKFHSAFGPQWYCWKNWKKIANCETAEWRRRSSGRLQEQRKLASRRMPTQSIQHFHETIQYNLLNRFNCHLTRIFLFLRNNRKSNFECKEQRHRFGVPWPFGRLIAIAQPRMVLFANCK